MGPPKANLLAPQRGSRRRVTFQQVDSCGTLGSLPGASQASSSIASGSRRQGGRAWLAASLEKKDETGDGDKENGEQSLLDPSGGH